MKLQIALAAILLAGVAQAATGAPSAPSSPTAGDGDVIVQSTSTPAKAIPQYVSGYSIGEDQRVAEEGRSNGSPSTEGTGSNTETSSFRTNDRGSVPAHK